MMRPGAPLSRMGGGNASRLTHGCLGWVVSFLTVVRGPVMISCGFARSAEAVMLRASSLLSFGTFAALSLACAVPAKTTGPAAKDTPAPEVSEVRGNIMRQGDLEVRFIQAVRKKVPVQRFKDEEMESKSEALSITIELKNVTKTKKVEYHAWSDMAVGMKYGSPVLKDNFGNTYRQLNFGIGATPVGTADPDQSIHPDQKVLDTLVFELPLANATHLELELPAVNYGNEGKVRFRINMPPPPKAKPAK